MKRMLTIALALTAVLMIALPQQSVAAVPDTLVVYATPKTLDEVITADTVAGGLQAHKVYKLVSLDTTYIFSGAITVKSNLTVVGKVGTNGRPPCIQPAVLNDNSIPLNLFILNGKNTVGTFKNLYLLGLATNNSPNLAGVAITVSNDNIKLVLDNCVFEEWLGFAIGYNGNWDSFFITNCKFRNMNHPNQWYVGEVLRNMWPGAVYTDTIMMKYNTFFCINGYMAAPVTKYYERYFEFSHNSVVYNFKNPFFIFNVTDAKINNNIFYAAYAGGISKAEYPWWDQLWTPEVGSVIDLDNLDLAKDSVFNPADIGKANFAALCEAKRTIEVKNNVYFWPTTLTNYWKAWNDTAHVDSIYTATWMNTRTTAMFNDKTQWPGLVAANNLNADPQFGASVNAVLNNTKDGFLDWFKLCRQGALSTTVWGYQITQVGTAANWVPAWPLPEANDMKYANTTVKGNSSDGKPLGDPYWFNGLTGVQTPSEAVPTEFGLQANYPNPFNPSTRLTYTLTQAGVVTLKVYNTLGQVVMTLVNKHQAAGQYTVAANFGRMTSGMYFGVLEQGTNRAIQKMILVK